MPGMPQSFDKLVTSLDREIAAMTLGAEQIDVVWNERQSEDQHPGKLEETSWPYWPNARKTLKLLG